MFTNQKVCKSAVDAAIGGKSVKLARKYLHAESAPALASSVPYTNKVLRLYSRARGKVVGGSCSSNQPIKG